MENENIKPNPEVEKLECLHEIIIDRASKEYGYHDNITKTSEECNELSQAICKMLLCYHSSKSIVELENNIIKEIADVKICIAIIEKLFDPEVLKEEYNQRMERLERRLNEQREKQTVK